MIAVDAMGGDRAPHAIVKGAVAAASDGIPLLLCGDQDRLEALLEHEHPHWRSLPISIQHAPDSIGMEDDPVRSVKKGTHSSLVVAMKAVQSGDATAVVSAGNSGAVLVSSIMYSGRIAGVRRPAVGGFLPTKKGKLFCLDLGANVDCKPDFLYQFALMGHAFVQVSDGIDHPRVALLSNGHEPGKGPAHVKKVFNHLAGAPINFVGNIESRDIFDGDIDVLVCDGFVGNVLLKGMQGTARALFTWLKEEATTMSWWRRMALYCIKPLFAAVKCKTDAAKTGGALLLGVSHPVILAHGNSDAAAIANAIRYAQHTVDRNIVEQFKQVLVPLLRKRVSFTGVVTQKVKSMFHWRQS